MILNCFNLIRFIKEEIHGFDDSIYIEDYSISKIVLSIDNLFDWEKLSDKISIAFPQGDFEFSVIESNLNIIW